MSGVGRFSQITRNFVSSAVKQSGHGPIYQQRSTQSVVPFNITNKYRFTAVFALYFGSAFAIPFLMVRYRLKTQ